MHQIIHITYLAQHVCRLHRDMVSHLVVEANIPNQHLSWNFWALDTSIQGYLPDIPLPFVLRRRVWVRARCTQTTDVRKQHLGCLGRPGGTTPKMKHTAPYLLDYPMVGANCSIHRPFNILSFMNDIIVLFCLVDSGMAPCSRQSWRWCLISVVCEGHCKTLQQMNSHPWSLITTSSQ